MAMALMLQSLDADTLQQTFTTWILEHIGSTPSSAKRELVEQIKHYIDIRFNQSLTLEEIAERVFLHSSYASTLFKEKTGITFQDYLKKVRLDHAKRLLENTTYRIERIASMTGYDNVKYFYRLFKNETGETPSAYRDSCRGVRKGVIGKV
ncbi:helix-turn-helix domain-containing protein [Paenibacillus yanchengensis]|uniref:Helix-turn-helix domain-containing protein n=1 Tax=Paenibacillus yanchengensis TaxID=2035833 RepID=A0ABW4YQV0_9BACL